MNTNRDAFLVASLLLASAALNGCTTAHSTPAPATRTAVPVRVVTAERTVVPRTLRAVGRLAQKRSLSLAFKNGGTVRQLLVAEGQVVHRGQRLAIVDATEIDAQVAQARASVEKADRDLGRTEKLRATQAAAPMDADNAHTAADLAHASLAAALYNQNATSLVAPEDGRIDKRLVEVGEQVAPGTPIFTMSGRAAGLVVRVGVVDRDVPDLRLGDRGVVQIDALPGQTFAARVSEIATTATPPAGTYEIELRLDTTDAPLIAGMTAKVDLQRPLTAARPVVPLGALIDAEGMKAALYRLVDGTDGPTVQRVPIELAYVVGDRAVVARGLSGGERVISEGASFIEAGRLVRPVAAEMPDARR